MKHLSTLLAFLILNSSIVITLSEAQTYTLPGSVIADATDEGALRTWLGSQCLTGTLLYRKSTDGANATTFRNAVAGHANTVVLIKANSGRVFGAYRSTAYPAVNYSGYQHDPNAFLISFTDDARTTSQPRPQYATYDRSNYGPTFGGGHDLYVNSSMNGGYTNVNSYASSPSWSDAYLAGSYNSWSIDELEVYELSFANACPLIGTVAVGPHCTGDAVNVPFTVVGTFNAGNTFTAQLSDENGDFSSPTNIGTLNSTSSGTISATIPAGIQAGLAYRIRITSSNPSSIGEDNGADITLGATTETWYLDADGDGYYTGAGIDQCGPPSSDYTTTVTGGGDCDDDDPAINPAAVEITCNYVDENCDGMADDDLGPPVITVPADITTVETGGCTATVTYTAPTATDPCPSAAAGNQTFTYTGAVQTFTVPVGVTEIHIEAWGAQGGDITSYQVDQGGRGGYSEGDLAVSPGNQLNIYVGGKGEDRLGNHPYTTCELVLGGWNGGGSTRTRGNGTPGGGASDIRMGGTTLNDRIIVAGGGGGCGYRYASGGDGGGLVGANGTGQNGSNTGAIGGTQVAGGAQGPSNGSCFISAGSLGIGGDATGSSGGGGAGGGGYYGGGGGGWDNGGGGGSSYIGGVSNGVTTTGGRVGDGLITISWQEVPEPTVTQTAGLASGSVFPQGTTTNTFEATDEHGNTTTESFTVTITGCTNYWTGNANTVWNNAGNWSSGVPTSSSDAVIPTNPAGGAVFPVVGITSAAVRDIEIESGATLTISGTNALTVDGTLTNDGDVYVSDGGSLVQTTGSTLAGGGDYHVTRNGRTGSQYNFWSSPITAHPNVPGNPSYAYNPAAVTQWTGDDEHDPGWGTGYNSSMTPGVGYAGRGGGATTFTGTVNNGPVTFGLDYYPYVDPVAALETEPDGSPFNLTGNPYPSAINAAQLVLDNTNDIEGTIYFWNDDNSAGSDYDRFDFAYWNHTGGLNGTGHPNAGSITPNGFIASAQGFYVQVKPGHDGTLEFNNAQREVGPNDQFLRVNGDDSRLWLRLQNDSLFNQILIGVLEDATTDEDPLYDAVKMRDNTSISMSAVANDLRHSIMAFPPPAVNSTVPLRVEVAEAGTYSFVPHIMEGFAAFDVYLTDVVLNTNVLLEEEASVPVQLTEGLHENRFFLNLVRTSFTDIGDRDEENDPFAYAANGLLHVGCTGCEPDATIQLMDMSGRIILKEQNPQFDGGNAIIPINGFSAGVYIVRITTENQVLSQKIINR